MITKENDGSQNPESSYSPPAMVLCVGAVVVRDAKILFVRQTYGGLQGRWSLPWGFVNGISADGYLESPDLAALRETCEEAGIVASVEGLLGIQNHTSPNGEPRLYLIFLCRHVSGEPAPDLHETDQAAYLSLDDLLSLNESVDEYCLWHAQRVLRGEFHLLPPLADNPYGPHLGFC
jgi:ADP-ribose pyrophosphatase YjhB (NUDIX family)